MSYSVTTDIHCDTPLCGQWTGGITTGTRVERMKAWDEARHLGWTRKDGKHYCPACSRTRSTTEERLSE